MPTILTHGIQLPDKGSVDWYSSMQSNYNLIDTHLGNTDIHVTAEDKANWNSKQGSLSQAQLDAIAQVATNTSDIATLQSGKANASHTHSSSDITDIGDYATKQYVDNSISGLVDNAPDALNTLNELSAALNDDSNFASTVTTALAAKANSADLATVATSGSYDDLSNKPTIPTNTSDLNNDSGFVTLNDFDIPAKTSDLTNDSGFITSSNVPTSTSDLINDSNFVDTSNSAVSSGITSAKVTSYDAHIADTDIHVTTADKTKWNNGVTQSYVLRYSSSSVTDNSTIAYSTLDNTDNIKSGDKVIDVDGKIFSIVSVDTANQTVTVGSALIDLALDANVVHTSGNDTVGGNKIFTGVNEILRSGGDHKLKITDTRVTPLDPTGSITSSITWQDSTGRLLGTVSNEYDNSRNSIMRLYTRSFNANGEQESHRLRIIANKGGDSYADVDVNFLPSADNRINLGSSTLRWNRVYATNYYYGSSNTEFSDKFVTTDTAQTISGNKTFSSCISSNGSYLGNESSNNERTNLCLRANRDTAGQSGAYIGRFRQNRAQGEMSGSDVSYITFDFLENSVRYTRCFIMGLRDWDSNGVPQTYYLSSNSGKGSLGTSTSKWATINGLEPSSLSLPSDRSARIDISSYFTNTGTGDTNIYTVPANGFINLQLTDLVAVHCFSSTSNNLTNYCQTFSRASDGMIYVLFPVRKDDVFKTTWYTSTTVNVGGAYFIPCQGNV